MNIKINNKYDLDHYLSLLPKNREWFSPKEISAIINRTDQFVRDAFDNQKILGHTFCGRSSGKSKSRKSYQIHIDAVILFLMESANYTPGDFMKHIQDILKKRTKQQLMDLRDFLNKRLES